jgi:hypothetical protein
LIIEPFFYTPHIETSLELAERLAERNKVEYIGPDILQCTTDETYKFTSRALIRLSRKRRASRYLSDAVRVYGRSEIQAMTQWLDLPDVRQVVDLQTPDLREVKFENFDIGMGILSSLLSLTRDTRVDPSRYAHFAMALARDALMLYRLTEKLIHDNRYDTVCFFNGRLAPVRGIRRACEASSTRYIVHERGSSSSKFALFDCATPHQPAGYRKWVDAWWSAFDDPERHARDFLQKRRRGIATSWYSFTGRQVEGNIPLKRDRRRVTFFTSSEDELAAIGDELQPDSRFCEQTHAIRAVGAACRERGIEYLVRFHPNTPASATGLMRAARDASDSVFEPSSEVDSYALFDSSDIVFTQNSTIGIEAAASGKPVFYAGRNIFEHCRSVRRIINDEDLTRALETLENADTDDALKYANFLGCHGIDYRYYKPRGVMSGTYRGVDLNAPLAGLRDLKLRLTRGG